MNFDREYAEKEAKLISAKADMKQHADKLIQGFEKLDETHAKRAIWELVQNACDLSPHCEIEIDFSNNGFSFSHNGKPFNFETLISLIKQVSSKPPDKIDEVGQFGTGFIATHSFGKKIKLNSVLKQNEFHIGINNFEIDRNAKNSDDLVEKLVLQQDKVYQLIREGVVLDSTTVQTTFSYLSDYPEENNNVRQAEQNLHNYLPIVLALNDSLKLVKVIMSDGTVSLYEKGNEEPIGEIIKIPVLKNGVPINIFCLRSEDNNIQVVLPLSEIGFSKPIDDSIAKMFLFFPLIGTENLGCNFIIHSKLFAPTEQRDGVHIKSKNGQTQEKEIINTKIIEKASALIFKFAEQNAELLCNPINIAHIKFETKTNTELINDYYKGLKHNWVDKFIALKLVETEGGIKAPLNVQFISRDLLLDENYYDAIYSIVSNFWKDQIPKKEIAQSWTDIVAEWHDDSIQFIKIEMLLEKIQEMGNLANLDERILYLLYEYLIKYNFTNFFEDYKLLPNIKSELVRKSDLKRAQSIDPTYISISDIIMPEVPKKYVKNNFLFEFDYEKYNRKNLSDDFNSTILAVTKDISVDVGKSIDIGFRNALIILCSIYPTETYLSARRQVMPKISNFYEVDYKEIVIPNLEDVKFDYDYTPFRALVKIFLIDIYKKNKSNVNWLENNIVFLQECLGIITAFKDLKDIIESLPIFPNQSYELCKQVDLTIEKDFPLKPEDSEYLKNVYKEIIGDIKNELVLNEFSGFLFHHNERTGMELSLKVEQKFRDNGAYEDIIIHPNKRTIFKIVQKITSNKEWSKYFQALDDKKAVIMMAKISDPSTKDDLFFIIGLEDKNKISILAELSKEPDFIKIVELGKIALEEEKRGISDFEFKHKIGVHIENLILLKIKKYFEGLDVKVDSQQKGQDMVVRVSNEVVYFIEVKSRWNIANSITMSNLQIKNSTLNKERYSLCCVEMCGFEPTNGDNRYEVTDITEILDRIKFVNDIGEKIEPLISYAMKAESNEHEVKLTDEYRAIIPQAVVNKGMQIESFVDYLINYLELNK